ncbi:MAG: hypothetical protein ACRD40_00300 [Candidatus Acidiferrales bacterium]
MEGMTKRRDNSQTKAAYIGYVHLSNRRRQFEWYYHKELITVVMRLILWDKSSTGVIQNLEIF